MEDIFSKTPTKRIECPNPQISIIIDTREKQSLIAANLIEMKANTSFEKLEIGDYLIGDIIIERKTFSDFISSMIDKRLTTQLIEMKKYAHQLLVLEGFDYNYSKFNVHENAIRGMILSIVNSFNVSIIYTDDPRDTAKFLITMAKKQGKEGANFSIRQKKSTKTLQEQKQFILEGFPGIGPTTANLLLENFSNLKKIFNAEEKDLELMGINKDKIQKFLEILND